MILVVINTDAGEDIKLLLTCVLVFAEQQGSVVAALSGLLHRR